MDLCLELSDGRIGALHHLHQQLEQLLVTADQLGETLLAAHICHALDQAEFALNQLNPDTKPH